MEVEKEVRYSVSQRSWDLALKNSSEYRPKVEMLDITMGAYGRESVLKTGLVFRVRKKPTKITLEIKKRIAGGWNEESIEIDSVERGINFLSLAGLEPYLYIARTREVRLYKGLKIFFDDIELLGKYIEIEYQDSKDSQNEIKEFCALCDILGEEQPLYGEIINAKYDEDKAFRSIFESRLQELISTN